MVEKEPIDRAYRLTQDLEPMQFIVPYGGQEKRYKVLAFDDTWESRSIRGVFFLEPL
jgi:hypothetical protein